MKMRCVWFLMNNIYYIRPKNEYETSDYGDHDLAAVHQVQQQLCRRRRYPGLPRIFVQFESWRIYVGGWADQHMFARPERQHLVLQSNNPQLRNHP